MAVVEARFSVACLNLRRQETLRGGARQEGSGLMRRHQGLLASRLTANPGQGTAELATRSVEASPEYWCSSRQPKPCNETVTERETLLCKTLVNSSIAPT